MDLSEFNEPLIHQVVTAYLATGRAGTRAQKTKAEVRGGGAKPWRQKGTGQARAGSRRSPIWRGGGVTFAAKTRSYAQKINKKMYRGAMRAIFSELIRQKRLIEVPEFKVESMKTKDLVKKLQDMKLENVLIITDEIDEKLYFAARNLPKVDVRDMAGADPVSLISFDNVLVTAPIMRRFEEMLG